MYSEKKSRRLTDEKRTEYSKALEQGLRSQACKVVDDALHYGLRPDEVYLNVVVPAHAAYAEKFARGEINAAYKHLSREITTCVLCRLREMFRTSTPRGIRVAATSVDGDYTDIGARVIADFLQLDGWEVDFLGVSTPVDALVDFVKERDVRLLALSASRADLRPKLEETIQAVRRGHPALKILIGGAGLVGSENLPHADALAQDPINAIAKTRQLLLGEPKAIVLEDFLKMVGGQLKALRESKNLSQREVAETAGLDRAYLSSVENGKQNITLGALMRLASALETTVSDLLTVSSITNQADSR